MQTSNADNFFRTETDLAREEAKRIKAERNRERGGAIRLFGKVLALKVSEDKVYTAESGNIVRQTSLLTGMSLRLFRGHTGPVTTLELYDTGRQTYLISGSWDKTIKVFNVGGLKANIFLASTLAHEDFVKSLISISSLKLLVSGSSDKTARIWDLSSLESDDKAPLRSIGALPGHTRPIDCLAFDNSTGRLYTGDSMGVINVWELEVSNDRSSCAPTLIAELKQHRTGVNSLDARDGYLWSASTDCTVLLQNLEGDTDRTSKRLSSIEHKAAVRCTLLVPDKDTGALHLVTACDEDVQIFDVSSFVEGEGEAELLATIDAHADLVTSLALWMKQPEIERAHPDYDDIILRIPDGPVEPWIVSGGLDGTVRKWRLANFLNPQIQADPLHVEEETVAPRAGILTEEEERELDELMDD